MFDSSYVLLNRRDPGLVARLLREFLPGEPVPTAAEFPLPQFASGAEGDSATEQVLEHLDELLAHLERHPGEPYDLHWRSSTDEDLQASAHFLRDGHLVLGLGSRGRHDSAQLLRRLAHAFPAEAGYVTGEDLPPDRAAPFRRWAQRLGGWSREAGDAEASGED